MKLILTIDTDNTPYRQNNLDSAFTTIKSALAECRAAAKRGGEMAPHNVARFRHGSDISWELNLVKPKRMFLYQRSSSKNSMNRYAKIWEIVDGELKDVIPRTMFQYQTPHTWVIEKLLEKGLIELTQNRRPEEPKYVQNFTLQEL